MMAKKTHCIRNNHDPAGIRHWQSRSAQNVCLHPCHALALRFFPFATRPSFKVWRRIKLLLHYTITILTSMASDRVVSINSRNTVRSIPMAVFPNVARPDGWTSWADQGFSEAIFSSVFPYRLSVLVVLCENARLHTAAPVKVSWPHVWRVCKSGVLDRRWSVRKPQNLTDTSNHCNEWKAKAGDNLSLESLFNLNYSIILV